MKQLFNPRKSYLAAWIWIHDVDSGRLRETTYYLHPTRPRATALYYAVASHLIITHGENVNAECGHHGTPYMQHHQKTPLCSAYDGEHLNIMRLLLEHGAAVDVHYDGIGLLSHKASFYGRMMSNSANQTPLHTASGGGQAMVAQLLLEHGAVVNAQDIFDHTPLYYPSKFGYPEVAQVLLGHGADVHMGGEADRSLFQVATSLGHVEVAQFLSEHGAEKE
ncbi:ankyrin repeat-containing domain protein [Russula vinacea]|nr:ankyrin repeat-containing domain protein [Russula vinacea]